YEFGVLKKSAEEALNKVPEDDSSYPESKRLLDFLSYSLPIDDHEISPTSILREFIGKSSFTY
ncbi:MAG: nucleoside kinase, partial [Candidatus Marinimicrobia bacterium]|nr:nucleoside kinase [Candidatus Neomarinimicrobiota bacterium]